VVGGVCKNSLSERHSHLPLVSDVLSAVGGCAVVGAADDEAASVGPDGLFESRLNAAVVA
jgi:hypothetical protein